MHVYPPRLWLWLLADHYSLHLTNQFSSKNAVTRDGLQCLVDLSLVWRPINVARSLLSARDAAALVGEVASLELRSGIGRRDSGELFAHRTEMEDEIKVSALFSRSISCSGGTVYLSFTSILIGPIFHT